VGDAVGIILDDINLVLTSHQISDEAKIWYILCQVHDDVIGIHKAGELLNETKLISKSWLELDMELANLYMMKM
jgi:hypothetical protein